MRKGGPVGNDKWWCKDGSWTQDTMMWNSRKLWPWFWGDLCEGVSHLPWNCEDRRSKQACVRTTIENQKGNIMVSVCSFSSHDGLFLSTYHKAVDSFSILCYSLLDENKLLDWISRRKLAKICKAGRDKKVWKYSVLKLFFLWRDRAKER